MPVHARLCLCSMLFISHTPCYSLHRPLFWLVSYHNPLRISLQIFIEERPNIRHRESYHIETKELGCTSDAQFQSNLSLVCRFQPGILNLSRDAIEDLHGIKQPCQARHVSRVLSWYMRHTRWCRRWVALCLVASRGGNVRRGRHR